MIELKDVIMEYPGHRALDGLCLSVPDGQVYGLLGPNGAGKSTTINLITGLLQPTSGRILVGGIDVTAEPERARGILAYVSESVALYPLLSGIENLQLFSRLAGRHLNRRECSECLDRAGLQGDAHERRVGTYSKGMRQKVGIAIALAKEARAVVLDEPSSGLDPSASHDLSTHVRNLASDGLAVLMATHDLFRARETCDSVGLLVNGGLRAEWKASEVKDRDLEAAYLDIVSDHSSAAAAGSTK
ncbi:MAG: ABC transporter ATP-binding protein [Planctomycetes bacterium]|nr:ABC transporter ATP-binding protein [Planctomycetota bacterium]MCP4770556.1 ABC transporter ATP-binding protein [Planctomycetota bacterium]MCP4860353.1 ABC transporter ATP-binding protein [Planctomycetota bacterium]